MSAPSPFRLAAALAVLLSLLGSSQALAADNDLHLHALYKGRWSSEPHKQAAQREFKALVTELGLSVAEQVTTPAESLGIAGFDIGLTISVADIPEQQERWHLAVEDERPNYNLVLTRLRFRKGLPFSFEISGNLSFLHESSMLLGGVELKWALNEGFYYFPDLAVRGTVNRLFGSRDLDLTTVTIDVWTSKKFSIAGMFTLAPFVGYSRVYIHANTSVMDPTPANLNDRLDFVFDEARLWANRVFFGLEFCWFIGTITFEAAFGLPQDMIGETVTTINTKLSLNF